MIRHRTRQSVIRLTILLHNPVRTVCTVVHLGDCILLALGILQKLGPLVLPQQPLEPVFRQIFVHLNDDGTWGLKDGRQRPVDEHIPCIPLLIDLQ